MEKFCPKCGKSIDQGIFCADCNPVVLEFKPINLKLCPSKKFFFRGKWADFDDLESLSIIVLKKALGKKVRVVEGLEKYDDLLDKTGLKKDLDVVVFLDGSEYVIPISVEVTSSPSFGKVGTDYFEGILQLRNADASVKKFVKSLIENTKDLYVNKVLEKKDSVDFYFVKKKFIGRVADKLVSEFGASADHNAQLFSQDKQSSKELFRLNVAVHIPPFRKGDVVRWNDKVLIINSCDKKISCYDLLAKGGFAFKYSPKTLEEFEVLKKHKVKIVSEWPLSVLSPSTYELVEVSNPLGLVFSLDDSALVVEHQGFVFLVG